jgi:hypothetical protein
VAAFISSHTARQRSLCSAKGGKELPMELTVSVTAIMAILSFGFLAAIILGMI